MPVLGWMMPAILAVAASQSTKAQDLDIIANFFAPRQAFIQMVSGACRVTYRHKLSTDAADVEMEKAMPGIHERMIAAAGAACDAGIVPALNRLQARIRADWSESASPAVLARLARLFAPRVRLYEQRGVQFREGDLVTEAVSRSGPTPAEDAQFNAALAAFARTPGGGALLTRVDAYAAKVQGEEVDPSGDLAKVIQDGLHAGHRAANAYAHEKGFEDVYQDQ